MDARSVAFQALLMVRVEGAYSNEALQKVFSEHQLSALDKGLVTEIVYGTLTHEQLLDHWLQPYFQGRVKVWIRILLAMTLYQVVYLEKIPSYAAIDGAVEIAKGRGGAFNGKTVNAILRKATSGDGLREVDEQEELNRWAIEYSHPEWLIRLWHAQFGHVRTFEMLRANNKRAKMVLRAHSRLIDRDELMKQLASEGVTCIPGRLCETAVVITSGNPLTTHAFKAGLFYVQDEASMLPAMALSPKVGAHVLDVCAAPGGKAFHLAEMVGEHGVVHAHDIYDHKIARIKENAKRLGIHHVEASICSALELHHIYEPESFDYLLVDAPCSGLGIMRRHPEVKFRKKPEDLDAIISIQKAILANSAAFLKPGGRLVYSTCTVNKKENQRQVETFLKENKGFELDPSFEGRMPARLKPHFEQGMLQLFPQDFETDGFFVASLVKLKK
ncbi:MAG: 16S rRNA (cytosine(967)-C(5))-methyltransferase RsmB [Defluviitaleaceae bacterium]|nr:16S rRNA (cytosine(967)-C(5))-methyltransferase RsmB [Defluviitaleaceae bacterium]